jgi:predicted nucleic acid-binding protein
MGFLIDTNVLSELRKKSKMDQGTIRDRAPILFKIIDEVRSDNGN